MQPKYLFTTIFITLFFALIIVLLATGSISTTIASPIKPLTESREVWADSGEPRANPAKPTLTTVILATPPATLQPDAELLLERNCTQCHITQWLEQIKKPRTEWESILAQMERMGVNLSENEKVILLNYLAALDES